MIETISACRRRVAITMSTQEVGKKIRQLVQQEAKHKTIKGFRTGSPKHLIFLEKQFQNYSEICSLHLQDLLKQEALSPVSQPQITVNKHSDGSVHYIAEFEVNPTISKIHWDQIVLDKLEIQFPEEDTITEEDVAQLIAQMEPVISHNNQENPTAPVALPEKNQLYKELQEGIERNVQAVQKEYIEKQAIETLLTQNPLPEVPESLVEAHYQSLQQYNKTDGADNEIQLRETARRTVTRDLLIEAYRKEHNIELNQEKLKARMESLNRLMTQEVKAGKASPSDFNRILKNKNFMYNLFKEVLQEQVIEHLIQCAQSKAKPIAYSKAIGLEHSLKEAFTKEIQKFADMKKTIEKKEEVAS